MNAAQEKADAIRERRRAEDNCRIVFDARMVEHHCGSYPDGTLTDVRTGQVVRP